MTVPIKCRGSNLNFAIVGSNSLYALQGRTETGSLVFRYSFVVPHGSMAQIKFDLSKQEIDGVGFYKFEVRLGDFGFVMLFRGLGSNCYKVQYAENWHNMVKSSKLQIWCCRGNIIAKR